MVSGLKSLGSFSATQIETQRNQHVAVFKMQIVEPEKGILVSCIRRKIIADLVFNAAGVIQVESFQIGRAVKKTAAIVQFGIDQVIGREPGLQGKARLYLIIK